MHRRILLLLAACTLSGCATPSAVTSFAADEVCGAPAQSPVCAAKSYNICTTYGDEGLCAKVGGAEFGRDRDPYKDLPPLEAEPWRLSWEEIAKRRHFCGLYVAAVEAVPSDRFNAVTPVPERLKGTHEVVMIIDGTCDKSGGYDVSSMFMRKSKRGWQIVSLDDWSVLTPLDPSSVRGSVCGTEKWAEGNGYCSAYHPVGIAPYRPEEILKQKWMPKTMAAP